jgi:hypothetical protein
VPQAMALLRQLRPQESFVLGDAKGNLVSCQSLGECCQEFQTAQDRDGFLFNTNHIHMPDLVAKVRAGGRIPKITEYSQTRFAALEHARASQPRNLPTSKPGVLWVADCPPCRNAFAEYPVCI